MQVDRRRHGKVVRRGRGAAPAKQAVLKSFLVRRGRDCTVARIACRGHGRRPSQEQQASRKKIRREHKHGSADEVMIDHDLSSRIAASNRIPLVNLFLDG